MHTGALLLLALVVPLRPAMAQLEGGTDLNLRSRYVWRGLTRHDGWVFQPDVFASYGLARDLRLTAGAWTNVQLAHAAESTGIGFRRRWAGETNLWGEVAVTSGIIDGSAGWTAYLFRDGTVGMTSPGNTSELYLRLETLELPVVVPRIFIADDVGAVGGAYLEAGTSVRVPVWTNVIVPIGSLILDGVVGWSLGQEVNRTEPDQAAYFARRGITHVDLSASMTTGATPLGPFTAAVRAEFHLQLNRDSATRRVHRDEEQGHVTWAGFTLSLIGPRCRPERRICRDSAHE
jgi:hypothetical protein